jgi:hypothetical protein
LWIFQDESSGAEEASAGPGIHHTTEQEYDERVPERLGVPKTAIHILDPTTSNSVSELGLTAK